MTVTGLESVLGRLPRTLEGKRIGLLCHAPSISKDFKHITELFFERKDCRLSAIFGPQHGLYGQTQDNMIEWQSMLHPVFGVPLFSLYGEHRKPTAEMLSHIDVLVVDLQDVGARLYTYIWTVKLCMEACSERGIPVVILDRPNPIGRVQCDGPVLKEDFFTFVGGACIPLCHRMTLGEMAVWLKEKYYPSCELEVIWMKEWKRSFLYSETGLPWVLPSPNMPTEKSAVVYPGTVLIEALNISEGRGTTIPFELFGSPEINAEKLKINLISRKIPGCSFRVHDFIPAFHKFTGKYCSGIQIHVTDVDIYMPVSTAFEIFDAIIETSPGALIFKQPPYEYEYRLMPFDILSGDSGMREALEKRRNLKAEKERWKEEINDFRKEFSEIAAYPEE